MKMQELLVHAVKLGASDIHLSAGERPALRVNGEIQRLEQAPCLDAEMSKRLA